MTDDPPENLVKSTQRSFAIVEALRELDGARLTDLALEVELPNSTVHNHLATLIDAGYVVCEDNTYRLTHRFLDHGEYTRSRRKLYSAGRPEIDELAATTGEIASLLVEERGLGVFLYSARGDDAVPLDIQVGKHVHMHTTALGKCILAGLPDERVDEISSTHGLPACTENTITDPEELRDELDVIREQGFARDDEERVKGVTCIAAPVKAETGKILGAISVSGPVHTLDDTAIIEALQSATNVVELKLVYS